MLVVLFPQQNRCCRIQCTFPVSPGKNFVSTWELGNLASEMHCLLVNCSLVSARGHFFILTLMAAAQCQVFHIAMLQWRAFSVSLTLTVQDLKILSICCSYSMAVEPSTGSNRLNVYMFLKIELAWLSCGDDYVLEDMTLLQRWLCIMKPEQLSDNEITIRRQNRAQLCKDVTATNDAI